MNTENLSGKKILDMRIVRLVIKWSIGLAGMFFCIGAAIKYWEEFIGYNPELSASMLAIGLLIMIAASFFKAAGWFVLMSCLGSPIRYLTALRAWSYSQIVGYIPGKLPVLLMRIQVCKVDGVSPSKVLAGTVLEIMFGLASTLSIWLASLIGASPSEEFQRPLHLIALICLLALLHPKAIMFLMGAYYRWRKTGWDNEIPNLEMSSILKPGGLYLLGWLLYGLGGYFILRSVSSGMPWTDPHPFSVAGAFTFAWAVGYLIFIVPGGLGAREGTLIWILKTWTPLSHAVIVSILARLCQMFLGMSLAGFWWLFHQLIELTEQNPDKGK